MGGFVANLVVPRGTTWEINLIATEPDGSGPADLTGAKIDWVLRAQRNTSSPALASKDESDITNIEITDGPAGAVTIKGKNADTEDLDPGWTYYHGAYALLADDRVIELVDSASTLTITERIPAAIPS